MTKILETERLILREFVDEDLEELYRMNSNKEVMKYVGDGSTRTYPQQQEELKRLKQFYVKNPGMGIWATILQEENTFIGGSGLVYYDGTKKIELGYRLLKEYWNQGLATEASRALLRYGFEELGATLIVSSAHPDNVASRRVMEKVGLQFKDIRFQYGCDQAYYEIDRSAYYASLIKDC